MASKPKCRRMADQMKPTDIEFFDNGASGDNWTVIGYLAKHYLKLAHFLLSSTVTCFGC